jgi:hypothetical protein
LDASGGSGQPCDEPGFFQGQHHLVDGRSGNLGGPDLPPSAHLANYSARINIKPKAKVVKMGTKSNDGRSQNPPLIRQAVADHAG